MKTVQDMPMLEGNRPLKIKIVGAGIGGLTAAIGLREQGHEVTLFERSQLAQEAGAAMHLAPNCHGILQRFGVFPETFGANRTNGITEYDHTGKLRLSVDLREQNSIWQHPWVLCHRIQLHDELKSIATSTECKGIPAVLKTSSRVVDVDPSTATVILEDGSKFSGDLVIGADGVSSLTRKVVVGDGIKPFNLGKGAFRFLIPRQKILDNPNTREFASREGYMTFWYASDRWLVMYPCSNNTIMNFVAMHPHELSASKGDGFNQGSSKEALLDVYKDFDPTVKILLDMVDSSMLKTWTLLDMERIPHWVKGRLALLGDAAHPFLPYQGQGGGIAIEDAGSLCALLPRGTSKDVIPERLALYEKIRDDRAHKIQEFTRWAGRDLDDEKPGKFNIMEFTHYNFGHDEWHNSTHALRKWLSTRNGPTYWRQPVSFGPMTSPRQDHYGRPILSHDARFVTHSVRIKTSATYLRTLFPTPAFCFVSPGTFAEATLQCTELDNLGWLGGGGYNSFGLWIHGVQYRKKDSVKLHGSFLPILFESFSDPITSGREELGMPKPYCDIKVSREGLNSRIICGWRGANFAEIELEGLQEGTPESAANGAGSSQDVVSSSPAQPPGDGRFIYTYVSAVGKPGVADAEYPVFVDKKLTTIPRVVEKTLRASGARIVIQGGDSETLPTIHHVAAGLSEIPIYSIIEAKVEGHGVEDLSQAERID